MADKISRKPKQYAFYSDGCYYLFNPNKVIYDYEKSKSLLNFHKELVALRNSKRVFITDENGKIVV